MTANFWQKLKAEKQKENKPIIVLAPMADVTDFAFRQMFLKYGRPDVFWTEFVSADGLMLAPKQSAKSNEISGFDKLTADLKFSKKEKPIVAQLFSGQPHLMKGAAELAAKMGFTGLDINMGCPDRNIEKQTAGSAMIKNPQKAREIIRAAKEGAKNIPVSVKTRLGYHQDELEQWLPILLAERPAVITLHARTRKEMSKAPAKWERIKRAVAIRDEVQKNLKAEERTLIFGNGDVKNLAEAYQKYLETGCDGVMIGRGIFGNPWVFTEFGRAPDYQKSQAAGLAQTLRALIEHTKLFEKHVAHKNFNIMKKHFKAYVEGFDGARELRHELMQTTKAAEVEEIIEKWLKTSPALDF